MPNERSEAVGPSPLPPGNGDGPDATPPPGSWPRRVAASLLRTPLFYKILGANVAAVALAAGLASWLTATHGLGRSGPTSALAVALLIAAVGGAGSALVNAFLVRRALSPLTELGRVAARIEEEGPDADVRARTTPTADSNLTDLIRVFNGMLDTMAHYRSRLRRLAARTLEAAEEERRLVARRLQEDTAQRLASLMVRLQVLRRCDDPGRRDAALDELREETAQALEAVRRTARNLYPPELGDIGLEQALRAFARTLANGDGSSGPRIEFDVEPVYAGLEEECRLALYRILQEALSNAYTHARASRIGVELRRDGDLLEAVVRDDGTGLPADARRLTEESLGLLTMQERTTNAGGTLHLSSRPGEGTVVRVELPLGRRAGGVCRERETSRKAIG